MKRWVKCLLAGLLCGALLLGAAGASAGTGTVYLMAVNDTVVEMTAENMPTVVGGTLYVPYVMLVTRSTGINLGVNAQYSASRQTVLISGGKKGVTFDARANIAYDLQGNLLETRAVVRNAMVLLPLAWLCDYFGTISYTTPKTRYGTLVRVTNSAAILNDDEFVDAADGLLRDNLSRYLESVADGAGATPSEGPVSSDPPTSEGPLVYVALLWGEQAEAAARQLENGGRRGLFLFTGEQLTEQDDLVRRLLGTGHSVGLDLTGETVDECLTQLDEWGALLADIGRTAVTVVRADRLTPEGRAELAQSGCAVWTATARGADAASAGALLRSLSTQRDNFVELPCDGDETLTTAVLQSLLGEEYRLRQAVAPALS